jgi:hypothetical protein
VLLAKWIRKERGQANCLQSQDVLFIFVFRLATRNRKAHGVFFFWKRTFPTGTLLAHSFSFILIPNNSMLFQIINLIPKSCTVFHSK